MLEAVRKWFERRITLYRLSKESSPYKIEWDDECLRLRPRLPESGYRDHEIEWSNVSQVIAFKRDWLTVDSIRLLFVGRKESLEVSEDDLDWNELIRALPSLLPGCRPESEWWKAVARPPFTANVTFIYSRLSD